MGDLRWLRFRLGKRTPPITSQTTNIIGGSVFLFAAGLLLYWCEASSIRAPIAAPLRSVEAPKDIRATNTRVNELMPQTANRPRTKAVRPNIRWLSEMDPFLLL